MNQKEREPLETMPQRLKYFRSEFISDNQRLAASKLGTGQSVLSNLETGKRPLTFKIVKALVVKYRLNLHWLLTGFGLMKA